MSLVVETASVHPYDDIRFQDCIEALKRQTYPNELMEMIVIDGGKVAEIDRMVRCSFPDAKILSLPGGTKFEQKNLGCKQSNGEIVAFVDGDCAPPPDWLEKIVRILQTSPPEVAGVQGLTLLTKGFMHREVSALFYGVRTDRTGYSRRLVTDNCAFQRAIMEKFEFENPKFSTVMDTLFFKRLKDAGYQVAVSKDLRMMHSYPGFTKDGFNWFFYRAYGVGYYMVKARRVEPALKWSGLIRKTAGIGWPALAAAKFFLDCSQLWQNKNTLSLRLIRSIPLVILYELALFLGGFAAVFRLPAPRWA